MINYALLKQEIFQYFHQNLQGLVSELQQGNMSRGNKSKRINEEIEALRVTYTPILFENHPDLDVSKLYMLLQYCFTVISFEYRHMVWPYEYMAFSRRNGELWERFCKAAWDNSQLPNLRRIEAPAFSDIRQSYLESVLNHIESPEIQDLVSQEIDNIFELVGAINMNQDEMFISNDVNHIIDFKSGFGSNEKGNTDRVISVGKAYKQWDSYIILLFLVRQNENNNYLEKIRRSNLWEIHCGTDAYEKIDELTGAGITEIREQAINFEQDLSPNFWRFLVTNNLSVYLEW